MGKIRVKTIGDEEQEALEAKKLADKKAAKEAAKAKEEVNETVEVTEEAVEEKAPKKTKKEKFVKARRSANYSSKAMEIDKNKIYSLSEGIELLRKVRMAKFDETVELHINTIEAGISGQVKLPHGTGKDIKVAIADDAVLAEVEKGKINFDILIASPSMMPKLAKVARVLGPKGLMPNPKNGTISENPEDAAKKFQGGQMSFKTENKIPVIHLSVGKMSFEDEKLADNIKTVITAIKRDRIKKVVLKSTMSPAIRLTI